MNVNHSVAVYFDRGKFARAIGSYRFVIRTNSDLWCAMRKLKANKCKCCNSAFGAVAAHLIFDEAGKQQNIAFLLFDYIGKRVVESDGDPDQQAVCDNCLRQLVQCYEFKQKCVQANVDDSEDDDGEEGEVDSNGIIEVDLDEAENIEKSEQASTENDYEFNKYAEIIEECENEDGEEDESKPATETEYEILNNICEFVLTKEYDDATAAEEQSSPIAAEVEYLDVEVEDDVGYVYAGNEESLEPKSEVIELTEFALDTTSKTVKTIDTDEELHRIKEKLKQGIPRHMVDLNQTMKSTAQSLDVEKIRTSDDLINILEADYQSENNYSRRVRDDADVFKIPKIDPCEEIEYLEEDGGQVCIDEYLKAIAYTDYVENYGSEFYCKLCSENLTSHQHMMHHIAKLHRSKDMSVCIFDQSCPVFGDTQKLQDHIFNEHFDLLPSKVYLLCSTCENTFDSPVQFGKHLCEILPTAEDERNEFSCESCDKKLTSRNRYLFHRQFHLENPRPKVCIICELTFQEEERFYNHVMFSHEKVFEHFCDYCDKSYSSSCQLDRHVRTHFVSRQPLSCPKCEKSFADKTSLADHICEKPNSEKTAVCQVCNKVYKRLSRLRKHMTSHESVVVSSVLTCECCCMIFGNDTVANDHCHRQHDDDTDLIGERTLSFALCCEYCENAYYDHLKLVEHKQKHQNDAKPFKCEFCMAKYDTYSKLKTHRNTHASQIIKFPVQRNYMCDRMNCWKRYRHWSDLLNHRKTVHLINPSIFKCTECEKTFYQSWKYDYHKKTSHGNSYTCDECNTLFSSIIRYKNHVKKRHGGQADQPKTTRKKQRMSDRTTTDIDAYLRTEDDQMFCRECDKLMSSRNTARTHIEMVHLKIKNFACEFCEKEFYLKKDLIDHTRIHTAETPFPCTTCEKQFRTTSMLNEHRKLHTNERRYKCPYCVAAFKRAYVLKNHIKQHIGIKEFVCPIENCDKEYRTQWELNFHCRKKHSPDTPKKFSCCYNACGIEFATSNDLTAHYESMHATDKIEKRKPKLKRAAPSTDGKKSATATKPKIIYVLPGPVEKTNNQDGETDADHNYPVKKRQFDTEASCAPKFVYILEPTVAGNATEKEDDSSVMDLGACQDIDDEPRTIIM